MRPAFPATLDVDRPAVRNRGAAQWVASWTPGGDALAVVAALVLVVLFVHAPPFPHGVAEFLAMRVTVRNTLAVAVVAAWATTALGVVGAYDLSRCPNTLELLANTLAGCTVAAIPVLLLVPDHGRWFPLAPGLLFIAGTMAGVLACRAATYGARRLRRPEVRVVIAGTGPRARSLWTRLQADRTVAYKLLAIADTPEALVACGDLTGAFADAAHGVAGVAVSRIDEYLMHTVVDEVFVALPQRSRFGEVRDVLRSCERAGVHAHHLADVVAPTIARPRLANSGGFPSVSLHVAPDGARLVAKRVLDIFGAVGGLVLLAPVLLAVAGTVRCTSPGPVFFTQERYGYRKRRFQMLKFRTMVADAERHQAALESQNEAQGPVFKIARDPRLTRVGAFLRRSSLDELPQLWNVLRGEMSLVGPRPLPTRDVSRFAEPWLMRRFSMRPGLTCLWQISGRSNVGFDEWVALDLQYIDHWSLALDGRILLQTVPAVLSGRGAR
ncbi:MAG TPA: sugar transferase [Gemmatirosa sp.]